MQSCALALLLSTGVAISVPVLYVLILLVMALDDLRVCISSLYSDACCSSANNLKACGSAYRDLLGFFNV